MKLLLDANLSYRLIKKLNSLYNEVTHVDSIFVHAASDSEIWQYALDNNCIIITCDDDYNDIVNFRGFPPYIVLLRTGNQSNSFIADLLLKYYAEIEILSKNENYGLLELF